MEGSQGGEKGREEAEVRLGGGWPTAPRDATLPSLGVWGEPGTAPPVLGKSGPVPAYVWAREPVSRWPFAVLVSGLVRSLCHLAGPEQLPRVALRPSAAGLAALSALFGGGLGGFLENKISVALPTGFKSYLKAALKPRPLPQYSEPTGVEGTETLGADVEPLPHPSGGPVPICVRQLHRGTVQGPLGVSLSSVDPGDAMTPLANQDSGPQEKGIGWGHQRLVMNGTHHPTSHSRQKPNRMVNCLSSIPIPRGPPS